jgi:nicotinate-nucleotide adenylyltransferase
MGLPLGLYYFGTFNPFHAGHGAVLQQACQQLELGVGMLWVVPTGQPPNRQNHVLAPIAHRLAMARLSVQTWVPQAGVLNAEEAPPPEGGVHYTAHTLQTLHGSIPDHPIGLLMGEDTWQTLPTWQQAQWLMAHVQPVVFGRQALLCQPTLQGQAWQGLAPIWLQGPWHLASATAIRQALAGAVPQNTEALSWLTPAVQAYIADHGLYQDL